MITEDILDNIRQIEIRSRRIVEEITGGAYISRFKGQGIEFEEVREYLPGDDIRAIDWNVTAKLGHPYIKQFTEEREQSIFIMADMSGSGDFGADRSKNITAAELAAVLSFSAVRNQDQVGLMLFTDKEELHLPPRRGQRHVLRMIRELIAFNRSSKKTNINQALERFMAVTKRKTVVFLISDLMDEGFEQNLKMINKKHDLTVINICDPYEVSFPKVPCLTVEDAEDGTMTYFKNSRLNSKSIDYDNKLLERNMRLCKETGVDLVRIVNGEDYLTPLMKLFNKRRR